MKFTSFFLSAIHIVYTQKAKLFLGIFCIMLSVIAVSVVYPKDADLIGSSRLTASEQERIIKEAPAEIIEVDVIEVVQQPKEILSDRTGQGELLAMQRGEEGKKKKYRQQKTSRKKLHVKKDHLATPTTREAERQKNQHRGVRQTGVYLSASHSGDSDYVDDIIQKLKNSGGTTFVFDVKGPYVYFESDATYAKELNLIRPLYALPDVIKKAKENNLYTIARFVAANDPIFGAINPDIRIRHPQTNIAVGSKWVNLAHPDTLRYNKEILSELASSGVDEINIDYIRYPTEYSLASVGLTTEEKSANVTTFVKMARKVIERSGRSTNLGVSTYAILGWNYDINLKTLGQDFVQFAEYVDIISPMAYPSAFKEGSYYNPAIHSGSRMYYLVHRTLEGYKELLGKEHAHKLRPWIQGYFITNKNMLDQMQAVYDAGSCGFTIWSAGNYYDIFYKMFPQMDIPKHCT